MQGEVDCIIEIGILQDHNRILAAHLENDAFELGRAGRGDFPPDCGRTGEADASDAWIFDQLARHRFNAVAAARDDIQDAWGKGGRRE